MVAEVDTISSIVSRLALRRLGDADWLTFKPVSYGDFGVEIEKEENVVIDPGRNREKEIAVGLTAPGNFKLNFTAESFGHFAEGVFKAAPRRTPSSGGRFGAGSPTATATGFDIGEDAAGAGFVANQLVFAEFWGENTNNGLHVVTGTTGNEVEISGLTVEGSPPAGASIKVVGYQFPTGDASMVVPGGQLPTLVSTANLMNDLAQIRGQWVYLGGSDPSNRFAEDHNSGLARVFISEAGQLTFDLMSGGADGVTAPVANNGAGLDLQIFYGDFFRNVLANIADFSDIVWELERTLGIPNPQASPGVTQAEYLLESTLDSAVIAAPAKKKLEFDLAFTSRDGDTRTGEPGDELRTDGATLLGPLQADAFNTSSNKLLNRIYLVPAASSGIAVPTRLFKFLTEQTLTLSNNSNEEDAFGEFGPVDITAGYFGANVEMTGHFSDVSLQRAVRLNLDVGYQLGFSNQLRDRQAGVLFDVPFGSVGGGRNNVEGTASIKTPLTFAGNNSDAFGYTASYTEFPYLP